MASNSDCPACEKHPCIHDIFEVDVEGMISPGEGGWYSRLSPEPIEVIEAWNMPHHLACALKYLARWDAKGGHEDLKKAVWYINRFVDRMEARNGQQG